jgi:RecA-family ATPase
LSFDSTKGISSLWAFVPNQRSANTKDLHRNASLECEPRPEDLEKSIREAIERRKPDIVALDPFIKLHSLEENDSGDMNFVCDLLVKIATETDIAVDIPHHVHKGQIAPGDADAGRGSSGIRDAGRLIYTLTVMSETEASPCSIPTVEQA